MKLFGVRDVIVRGNYVHDNYGMEIWFDEAPGPNLIEGNRIHSPIGHA